MKLQLLVFVAKYSPVVSDFFDHLCPIVNWLRLRVRERICFDKNSMNLILKCLEIGEVFFEKMKESMNFFNSIVRYTVGFMS